MNSLPTSTVISEASPARSEAWRGLRASLPVMLGFVPFALVLGAQAAQRASASSKCHC